MARVVAAMSGGVDSSMAVWLLRQAGHEVIGLFMRHGQAQTSPGYSPGAAHKPVVSEGLPAPKVPSHRQAQRGCCTAADAADARRVAEMLGVPFYVVDFQQQFAQIVDYFVSSYTAGRTPNPCILCNNWLKFGKLFQYADGVGAELVATGHYARVARDSEGQPGLYRGRDPSKDQSYVLFGIPRGLLSRVQFPLGQYRKSEVRRLAGELGLPVAEKRESQEICFVPEQNHARFVRQHRGEVDTSGEIVTTEGTVVGRHEGVEGFTIGQRKGLRVALGEPRYVVRIEPDTRRVVIGTKQELARKELVASDANWLLGEPSGTIRCQVKIRYRGPAAAAAVTPLPGGRFRAVFDRPCYGIAPGQAAVCYEKDRVLGGGWIE